MVCARAGRRQARSAANAGTGSRLEKDNEWSIVCNQKLGLKLRRQCRRRRTLTSTETATATRLAKTKKRNETVCRMF